MTFLEFHKAMASFIIFSNKNIVGMFRSIDRRRLYEWNKKGYITLLKNGYYIFNEFLEVPNISFLAANCIYEPSYISCEYALSYYSIIPESVFTITSVSTKKTADFKTQIGDFTYRNIKPALFTGYDFIKVPFYPKGKMLERSVLIASPEKAFFDYIYYISGRLTEKDIEELRFDDDSIKKMNRKILKKYLSQVKNYNCKKNLNLIFSYYDII